MTDQTKLLDLTAVLSEDAGTTAAPVILSVTPTGGVLAALTSVSDQLTVGGTAVAGATVTIYDGATSLGAVTADALGLWSYTTTAPLSDGAHAFAATATVLGVTSAESAATDVTVNSDIGSFTSVTDDWSSPISVDSSPYYVENANTGSKPYALTELDDHTLQFTLKVGDLWSGNDSSRSEIAGGTNYAANSVVNVSYQLTVQPGAADPNLDWLILGQVHADDSSPIVESLQSDYPVFAFHLTSATGHKGGDYIGIQAFYLPTGTTNPQSVTSSNNGFLYLSPDPIVRGSSYSIQIEGSFQDNANGFLDVWINGVEVVDYKGPIGYGSSNYWKEGVYEGYTQTQPITVDYANTMVSSTPDTACFCDGTLIATQRGEVAVEELRVGDCAVTASGALRPIVWIGHRAIDLGRHPDPARVQPVRVAAGAFGEDLPRRDLWLSPGHNVASQGALMPISCLINGRSVAQIKQRAVEYWHVELDAHDILLAEGLPAESYSDCGNRTAFANGGAFVEAHPDFAPKHWAETCLPLVKQGPAVAATKARLLARLFERGFLVDQETDAHIVADGVRVEPVHLSDTRLAFALPPDGREIVLRSKVFVPAHTLVDSSDARQLGLCVQRLRIDGRTVALAGVEACASGWQEAEYLEGRFSHCWTNGATPLCSGARIVIIDLASIGCYWREPEEGVARLSA